MTSGDLPGTVTSVPPSERASQPPAPAGQEALAAALAPAGGKAGESMRQATRRAEERAARCYAPAARNGQGNAARLLIRRWGLDAAGDAIGRYRAGGGADPDDDAAWLLFALRDQRVRDDAWARMDPAHREAHLRLWTDLTRRARPGYVAAPAALLAFTAWQCGNQALANAALDVSLADDPRYPMATTLRLAVNLSARPPLAWLPMSPEEVAEYYDQAESGVPRR